MKKLVEFFSPSKNILVGILDQTDTEKVSKGIIFVPGFERTTIESKFKRIIDALRGKFHFFRFDFSGCGLSDGSFEDFSVRKSVGELSRAIDVFKKETGLEEIILIGHSLGCCIILDYLKKVADGGSLIGKIIFLAPAFNQKDLLRYYFAKSKNKEKEITWQNYKEFLDEKAFLTDTETDKRMTKEHWLAKVYFLENRDRNYETDLDQIQQKKIIIQGDKDDKVPLESYQTKSDIVVTGGDHDLQRPDMVEQYLKQILKFIEE